MDVTVSERTVPSPGFRYRDSDIIGERTFSVQAYVVEGVTIEAQDSVVDGMSSSVSVLYQAHGP